MLGRFFRTLAFPALAVGPSALGCADLIGLNDLEGSGGSGGTADSGSGGTASGSGGESLGGGPNCSLDVFDDREFTDACWHSFNTDLLWGGDYSIDDDGGLVLTPEAGPVWFNGQSAFALYREVTGDFLLEVVFSTFDGSTSHFPETHPSARHVAGGVLAFPAQPGSEGLAGPFVDYYAVKSGTLDFAENGDVLSGLKSEYTVLAGQSTIFEKPKPDAWDETGVRLCRYGNLIWMGYRTEAGVPWGPVLPPEHANGYDTTDSNLPDLADTMYVGILSEIWDEGAADGSARVVFSRAQLSVPESFEDCTR